jgi:hypothetical protein
VSKSFVCLCRHCRLPNETRICILPCGLSYQLNCHTKVNNRTKIRKQKQRLVGTCAWRQEKRQHLTLSYPDSYQPEHEVGFPLRPSSLTSKEHLEYFQKLAPLVCISFVTNRCAIPVPLAVRHTYHRHILTIQSLSIFFFAYHAAVASRARPGVCLLQLNPSTK